MSATLSDDALATLRRTRRAARMAAYACTMPDVGTPQGFWQFERENERQRVAATTHRIMATLATDFGRYMDCTCLRIPYEPTKIEPDWLTVEKMYDRRFHDDHL